MTIEANKLHQATRIINQVGEVSYARDFQATYDDPAELSDALATIVDTVEPVTTPRNVQALSDQLALIASGIDNRSVLITGNCSEPVTDPTEARIPTERAIAGVELIAQSGLANSLLHIRRDRGQNTKPRSEEYEMVDGQRVPSYMGDAINSADPTNRTPDPQRLIDAAMQAERLEHNLTHYFGHHVPAAHEALNLYYERAFVEHGDDDKDYLLSADLPWIGMRTNGVDSKQVELLASVENSVGVKIGANSTPEHIEALAMKLNPTRRLGKIAWMLRTGLGSEEQTKAIIESIVAAEPEPLIIYDLHGSTIKREDGTKVRATSRIIEEIDELSELCEQAGTRLHGLHLETTVLDRLECVDEIDQTPTHEGGIDPQLNPAQTLKIVRHFNSLPHQKPE